MLTGKNRVCKKDFLIKLEDIEHHPLNASRNLKILFLVSQLPNLGFFVNGNFKNL